MLKQPQYAPMPVEQQVMIIFAVTNGYLDDVPVDQIREFEHGFHEFMRTQRPDIGNSIRTTKVIGKEGEQPLIDAINAYKETWAAQHAAPATQAAD
jgi:F-type H+-transporting ATPase subunit alpha